ncbi:uncharacterized protein LOC117321970 isoform X2 [Pecten maximus]|uniref:uncharacterized protein LOC117321970 isoform X2 n=1 Tax=Pecten maximus TaxID=6579 RepID=UPI0014582C8B|nr:uncharacterized protein LOC117321970 isoform X2 [Pecten maximus]
MKETRAMLITVFAIAFVTIIPIILLVRVVTFTKAMEEINQLRHRNGRNGTETGNTSLAFLYGDERSQGAEFSKGDIIFIAVVIGACVVAIIITIVCHLACRRRSNKGNQASLLGICCCYDNNVNSRFKVVSQKMGSDCAICLEEKNMMVKPVVEITCKHTYHQACISKCLEMDKRAKCPQCRRQPGQYSTTERFIAIIQTLLRKRKERTLEAKTGKFQQAEEEEKMAPEHTDLPECSSYIPPEIPPDAIV